MLAAGCVVSSPGQSVDEAPWKQMDGEAITGAPDAGGELSFRNCPTLAEAQDAIPAITGGPDANAVPFKSMVLQCSYALPGRDLEGHVAGISVLVFDARADGADAWAWELDADMGSQTAIPELGDVAVATSRAGRWDVWVSADRFGIHILHTSPADLALGDLTELARRALDALERPAR